MYQKATRCQRFQYVFYLKTQLLIPAFWWQSPLSSQPPNRTRWIHFLSGRKIPEDIPAIFEVNYQAFAHEDEARLVDTLRDAKIFNPELSLVAVHGDRIIGHIMFPPITIESSRATIPAIALAPLVVHPDYQCLGVGAALIEEGLNACRKFGHRIVIVIGHPGIIPGTAFTRHGTTVLRRHSPLMIRYSWYLPWIMAHSTG